MPLLGQELHTLTLRSNSLNERMNHIHNSEFKDMLSDVAKSVGDEKGKLDSHITLLKATMKAVDIDLKLSGNA